MIILLATVFGNMDLSDLKIAMIYTRAGQVLCD